MFFWVQISCKSIARNNQITITLGEPNYFKCQGFIRNAHHIIIGKVGHVDIHHHNTLHARQSLFMSSFVHYLGICAICPFSNSNCTAHRHLYTIPYNPIESLHFMFKVDHAKG